MLNKFSSNFEGINFIKHVSTLNNVVTSKSTQYNYCNSGRYLSSCLLFKAQLRRLDSVSRLQVVPCQLDLFDGASFCLRKVGTT
jgi:hypothetical protein